MNNHLSAVIITRNEERNIGRCIESVKNVADEIVVVDSLSTDRTKEICLSHHVRFIEQPFLGYIEQKNFAIQQAKHDMILSLDADEALDEQLALSIQSLKDKGEMAVAYKMNRRTNFCGRWILHGRWYPDQKIRLFNRKSAHWGGENPHDKIILPPGVKPIHIKGDILHYSYYTIEEYLQQMNRFTTIQADAMFRKGKNVNWVKIYLNPFFAFIRAYFIERGFLDGYRGLVIAYGIAYTTLLKYVKLKRLKDQAINA